jgi:hypothetical protein
MDGDFSPADSERERLEAITDVDQHDGCAKEEKPVAEYTWVRQPKREWRQNQPEPAGPGPINVDEWNSWHL